MFKRSVIRPLSVLRKTATRKLPALQMVSQAVAAHSLLFTRAVSALAVLEVTLFLAFHRNLLNESVVGYSPL